MLLKATLLLTLLLQGSTTFDVSVIHHPKPDAEGSDIDTEDSIFQAENANLKRLLDYAYDIRPDFIFGIPPALESKHYDVTAKVLDPDLKALAKFTKEQRRSMLIPVLEERFALKAHLETKEFAVYELTAIGPSKLLPLPGPPSDHHSVNSTGTTLTATNIPIEQLCGILTNFLHKTVIDKTGLTGNFTLSLKWSPDDNTDPANGNSDAPPLLTAVQEQLGLKLKSARGPVPTLVVDHIEPPTEN